jgi:sigma-B regulation protein RsbU (phosphoserine phosphatase)
MDAIEHISDGFVLYDANDGLVISNSQWRNFYKYSKKDAAPGTKYEDLVRLDTERMVIADKGEARANYYDKRFGYRLEKMGSFDVDLADGRSLAIRERDTTEGGRVGIHTDITERKQAEEELQEAYGIIKDQKERMEKELNVAHEIQMSMVPLTFPPFPERKEFSIYATLEPAREVGGDFYDFFFIDEDRLCFCVGDVSGKGVPAALFMAVTRTMIKSKASDDRSTASILTFVNGQISQDNPSCMFVTLWVGVLNIRTGEVTYTNAGHNPPYVKRVDGSLEKLDMLHGPVVGAAEGFVYGEDKLEFSSEDLLLAFTDGVTEEIDVNNELYGEMRLEALLSEMTDVSVERSVQDVVASVREFQGESAQDDDITVLALQFHA